LKHIYKLRIYFIIFVGKFYKTLLVHSIFIAFKCIMDLILHINDTIAIFYQLNSLIIVCIFLCKGQGYLISRVLNISSLRILNPRIVLPLNLSFSYVILLYLQWNISSIEGSSMCSILSSIVLFYEYISFCVHYCLQRFFHGLSHHFWKYLIRSSIFTYVPLNGCLKSEYLLSLHKICEYYLEKIWLKNRLSIFVHFLSKTTIMLDKKLIVDYHFFHKKPTPWGSLYWVSIF